MRDTRPLEELVMALGVEPGLPLPLAEPELLAALEAAATGRRAAPGPHHVSAARLVRACLGEEPPASPAALGLALAALGHARRLAALAEALSAPGGPGEALRTAALEAALARAALALTCLPGLVDEAWVDAPLAALDPAPAPALAA